ncbi:MAG: pilus assembly protein N-terminal domain-containing protein [Planctomycetaceae bacterium]|nr:pilus assembly protein N-terminal domain-containing protein [Planctomycetaceae bacterium]
MRTSNSYRRLLGLACSAIVACSGFSAPAQAQPEPPPDAATQAPADSVRPSEQIFQVLAARSTLTLVELQTRVVELQSNIRIVDGFDQTVVSVTALGPKRLRLRALKPGVTTLTMTDEFSTVYNLEVFVEGDIRELQAHLQRLFPGSAIEAIKLRESIVLRGWVTEPDQIPQVVAIAEQFAAKVHNQMAVAGENLVQLNVKVMEVQRSKIRELGFNFLDIGQNYYFSSTPGSIVPIQNVTLPFGGPPTVTSRAAALADATMQFAVLGDNHIFQGFLLALQQKSLLKILAEPKLTTTSGRPASLLSGGEFPILVPQGLGTATIQWREFGVRMEAVPIVLGNGRLRLDISPEVSDRDFSNAVNLNGTIVPGLTTRRVNTQVEMRFADTLMIGGLISTRKNSNTSGVPILQDLPVLGMAFRRVRTEEAETELLIMVTPYLVSPLSPGEVPPGGPGMNSANPTTHELFIDGALEVDNVGDYGYGGSGGMMMPGSSMPTPAVPVAPPIEEMPTPSQEPLLAPEPAPPVQQTSGVRTPGLLSPRSAAGQSTKPRSGSTPPGLIAPQGFKAP